MEKAEGTEGIATVDAIKVKEENLEVAGGRCWKGFWLNVLCVTGEKFNEDYPLKVVFATIKGFDSKLRIELAWEHVVLKQKFKYF